MLGIVPSATKTYEVYGSFNSDNLVEGKLYYKPDTGRLYYYSKKETRSNPNTGYFPVWDGSKTYVYKFSKEKYYDKDVTKIDIETLCSSINQDVAKDVLYKQRRSENDEILNPQISDGDNMFTQCVKGIIKLKKLTMIDLIDMAAPRLTEKMIENYYAALIKISFMRMEKWHIWVDMVLHVRYVVEVYKGEKKLLSYYYPENKFDTGIVKYDDIVATQDDPFKKIIKILMVMENITKTDLRIGEHDDYTVNNMMTTINSTKPLSAQLFSRFIHLSNLSYSVKIYEKDQMIFEYRE